MVRGERVKEHIFGVADLTIAGTGSIEVFSRSINGTIKSINWTSSNYTALGSLLLFESGTNNDGTALGGMIMRWCIGSEDTNFYPLTQTNNNQGVLGSFAGQPGFPVEQVIHGPLRLVGSGLGTGSGLGLVVRYI